MNKSFLDAIILSSSEEIKRAGPGEKGNESARGKEPEMRSRALERPCLSKMDYE